MRIVTRNESGAVELFQFKAMKTLSRDEIKSVKEHYFKKCQSMGDTPAGRREALFLTLNKFPGTLNFNTITL
jgi:hypothetical protein